MDRLQCMHSFLAVAETGSVSEEAEVAGLAQVPRGSLCIAVLTALVRFLADHFRQHPGWLPRAV